MTHTPSTTTTDRRQMLLDEIAHLLQRARESRLEILRQFLQMPSGRVFLPRSSQGSVLFSRMVDLDVLFSRAEQKLHRDADPTQAFEQKTRLERDICQLHVLLIEICAGLAATYDLEPADPAVIAAVRRIRQNPLPAPAVASSTPGR